MNKQISTFAFICRKIINTIRSYPVFIGNWSVIFWMISKANYLNSENLNLNKEFIFFNYFPFLKILN